MTHFIEQMSKAERKAYRNDMRDNLIAAGGCIYSDGYSRVTVVIEPIVSGNNCKSFRVATAFCNHNDKFRKSVGEAIALYRLYTDRCNVIRCENLDNTKERMKAVADTFISLWY